MIRSRDDYFPVLFDMEGNRSPPSFASFQLVTKVSGHLFNIIAGLEGQVFEIDVIKHWSLYRLVAAAAVFSLSKAEATSRISTPLAKLTVRTWMFLVFALF